MSVNEHFRILEILYIYTSFSASYPSIRQPEIDGLGRLERKNMDRQFEDDLGMFVNYSVRERERERVLMNTSGARLAEVASAIRST